MTGCRLGDGSRTMMTKAMGKPSVQLFNAFNSIKADTKTVSKTTHKNDSHLLVGI